MLATAGPRASRPNDEGERLGAGTRATTPCTDAAANRATPGRPPPTRPQPQPQPEGPQRAPGVGAALASIDVALLEGQLVGQRGARRVQIGAGGEDEPMEQMQRPTALKRQAWRGAR